MPGRLLGSTWSCDVLLTSERPRIVKVKEVPLHQIMLSFLVSFQCVVVLNQAQSGVMDMLVSTGTISCAPPFSARARGTCEFLLLLYKACIRIASFCQVCYTYAGYAWVHAHVSHMQHVTN